MATQHNKYGPGYAPKQVKHHEWRTAENSAAHLIPHLGHLAAQTPNLTLLDVGAGSGTISASLAKYIPQGHVLATDISDEIVERAKEFAEANGVENMSFQTADIYNLGFPDASFDIVHASQVLCHLDSPCDAIKELVRVAKPGGIIALRETDMHMWCITPSLPPLLHFHALQIKTLLANGGQDKGGRELLPWALRAGVPRESITLSFGTWCFGQAEDKKSWSTAMAERSRQGQARGKAIELGLATEEEMDGMATAWEEWSEMDGASLGIMNGELIIKKQ